jgi:hypothetical protein
MLKHNEQYSPEEAAKRRDSVLRIMANTAPQPHATDPPGRPRKRESAGVFPS